MFYYTTYEEANKMKERISDALLCVDENVVSVGTEREKMGELMLYSVKIGLVTKDTDTIWNVVKILKEAKIVDEHFDDLNFCAKPEYYLSAFVEVGHIFPLEQVPTGRRTQGNLGIMNGRLNKQQQAPFSNPITTKTVDVRFGASDFTKSTADHHPSTNLNFLYKNRTFMRSFALSAVMGIGLTAYTYSNRQKKADHR